MNTITYGAHSARKPSSAKFAFIAIGLLLLSGCATKIPTIDLSETVYTSPSTAKKTDAKIALLTINNTADIGESPGVGFGDAHMPIARQPLLHLTVEQDIRRFFEERMSYDSNSNRTIVVNLEKADAYWNWPTAERIPFVGLATMNRDRDIGMNLKVSVSVQDSGVEVASYSHNTPIIIQGKATTQAKISVSYKKLVAAYREKIFTDLDTQIIARHFAK